MFLTDGDLRVREVISELLTLFGKKVYIAAQPSGQEQAGPCRKHLRGMPPRPSHRVDRAEC